jgi:hypothetical protein
MTITEKQAHRIATTRGTDAYGTKDYLKGRCYSHGLEGTETLPKGYEFYHVPTWGIHVRAIR